MKVVDSILAMQNRFEDVFNAVPGVENLQNQKTLGHPYIDSTTILSDNVCVDLSLFHYDKSKAMMLLLKLQIFLIFKGTDNNYK